MAKSDIFSVKFNGESLKERGVPIYDLGVSLIAIQRIVNKAYLVHEGQLSRNRLPHFAERQRVALQIRERRRGSDIYDLSAFLSDPGVQSFISQLTSTVVGGLMSYLLLRRLQQEKGGPPVHYTVAIFNQISDLSQRVQGIGGIETIEISSPSIAAKPLVIDTGAKNFLSSIKGQEIEGPIRGLTGRVTSLDATSLTAKITDGQSAIEIILTDRHYDAIRKAPNRRPWLELTGKPVYRLGVEKMEFERFRVATLNITKEEEKNA